MGQTCCCCCSLQNCWVQWMTCLLYMSWCDDLDARLIKINC